MSSTSLDSQLWNSIHMVGRTFIPGSNDTKTGFVCFFDCLSDLLPNDVYRRVLKSFIVQNPSSNSVNSQSEAFRWTYNLHAYANLVKRRQGQLTNDITLEQAMKKYANVNKTDWGNAFWFIIHYIAANLPERLSLSQQTSFIAFIMCISYLIPCAECKQHMALYITQTDIRPYAPYRKTAFQYTCEFHNNVNGRLSKPTVEIQKAYTVYRDEGMYSMIDE
jgi:hypothetical protein